MFYISNSYIVAIKSNTIELYKYVCILKKGSVYTKFAT